MSMKNKINGVYRDASESFSKLNGVWRKNNTSYVKINGVWRSVYDEVIELKDIIGFKLIYTLNKARIHYDNPRLKYNANIPHSFKVTGDSIGKMDFERKGVIFEYKRDLPEEEGIVMYEGRLYAVLSDGKLFNVCQIMGNNIGKKHEEDMKSEFSNIYEIGKLTGLDIKINGSVSFEDYGYYFSGWNNIFNTKPFMDQTIYPDKFLYKKSQDLNSYNILPIDKRDEYFDSVSTIGIARDMQTPIYNMTGSYGNLNHTITSISLNGINMPYVIEIKV